MITKYGVDVFIFISVSCVIIVFLSLVLIKIPALKYGLVAFSILAFLFTANFFRDPERITPSIDNGIIAPADGEIIGVKEMNENEFMKSSSIRISIFMSPLNVHVNRNPISGTVRYYRYIKGEYFAAFEDKASEKNEQNIIGIENERGKVVFRQIAGFIARRIVCTLKEGDSVKAGERFGMIKFGSRVDVYVPSSVKVLVKNGQKTEAGVTVLAEFQ
jgi:phosphatidylserine decarboxylase